MADLQFTVSALDKATAALLKVAAQLDKVGDKLDKLDGKVAKVTAALDDKASPGLNNIERKVKDLDGKKATVKVDVDKSLGDSLIKINLLGKSMKNIALGAGAIAAAPQIAALGAAAVTASGALGVLPGLIGAAGLAAGTAQVAFGGLIKFFTADSAKKQGEAYASLTDSGKKLADTIKNLTPQFKSLHDAVQNAALRGFVDQVKPLAATYLPMLQREMVGVAQGFNVAGTSLAQFFRQKNTVADMQGAFMSMRIAVNNTIVALKPLAQAFTDIFVTSTARLPSLTQGIGEAAAKFAAFIRTARESGQLGEWIDKGVQTAKLLGQTLGNVGSIILSVFHSATAEGANLVQTLADVTGKIAAFLKSAQGQDALKSVFGTIREAVAAVTPVIQALLPLLSTALVAAGTSLVKVFQALGPPLRDIAEALARELGPILPGIADAFGRIALALVPMVAPAQSLIPAFHAIAAALAEAAKVAADFFSAMANTGTFLFKSIVPMITGLVQVLTGLLHVIEPIAPALGVIVAAFLAFKTASAGIAFVQGALGALGGKIADAALNAGVLTEKFTGSANAGEKVATAGDKVSGAFSKVGAALPVIGIGIAAIGMAYEEFGGKADQAASKVIDGSLSMQAAVKQEGDQIHRNQIEWLGGMNAQESYAAAAVNVRAELDKQLAALGPMARLQADVTMAQTALNDAVAQFGPHSQEAATAASGLALAKDRLKAANEGAAQAEKTLGDQIVDTQNKAAAAANADVAYQQAILNIQQAEQGAAQAVRDHGAASTEAQQAHLQLMQAYLSAADAARRKAEADAEATGASNAAEIGAQAYKEELIRLADQATGPTRDALLQMANGTDTAKQAASTAEIQSRLYKDELGRLAGQANGPLADALRNAKGNFDTLGGAHASAEDRARAQKAELQRLADMASGPVKASLQQMADQIRTLPDGDFTVTGIGKVSYGSPELLRAAHGGYTGGIIGMGRAGLTGVAAYADGGVTPGYTPGRDVHRFRSATGGTLDLSGGEAVMRPEFTAAVGPGFVHGANAAARSSGVNGVRRYMGFAGGGIIDGLPYQRFVMGGGIKLTGTQPFSVIPNQIYNTAAGSLVGTIQHAIESAINALIAQVRAAAAAAARAAASAVGAIATGGGDAMSWIIAHESGGRNVKNPTSTASGYFQMINGTWKAYGGSTPTAMQASYAEQAAVAGRYVQARYGGWEGARQFWIAHGYYDRGGYLMPGRTLAMNATGTPERVLSPAETRVYERVSQAAAGGGRSGGDGAQLIAELQTQNKLLRALRGDVDQTGSFQALIGEIRGLRYQIGSGGGSAGAVMQSDRARAELGAWA